MVDMMKSSKYISAAESDMYGVITDLMEDNISIRSSLIKVIEYCKMLEKRVEKLEDKING